METLHYQSCDCKKNSLRLTWHAACWKQGAALVVSRSYLGHAGPHPAHRIKEGRSISSGSSRHSTSLNTFKDSSRTYKVSLRT